MNVELLATIDSEASINIPGWQDMRYPLDALVRTRAVQDLVDAHATTIRRVGSADFHFHVLEQVYVPEGPNAGTHTISWVQACAESVIFWLYTSLNSLAQELNLVYRFGIDEWKVDVTHPSTHDERPHSDCLKCRLIGEGDNLCAYLLAELDSDWFKLLNGLRNRITHRQLLSTNTNIGGQPGLLIEISHDPRARIFDEQPRTGIEIRGYCVQTRQNVVRVIGETYRQLIPRIGQI